LSIQNGQKPGFLWREKRGERSDNVKIALSLRRDKGGMPKQEETENSCGGTVGSLSLWERVGVRA